MINTIKLSLAWLPRKILDLLGWPLPDGTNGQVYWNVSSSMKDGVPMCLVTLSDPDRTVCIAHMYLDATAARFMAERLKQVADEIEP